MKLRLTTCCFLFLICSISYGQTNHINSVKLDYAAGELTLKPQLNDFFNEDILGAVHSGMNVTFHFYTELIDANNKSVEDQENQIHVRNDIWENQYSITGYKIFKKFVEFNDFKKYLLDSLQFKMVSENKISELKKLQLNLTFSPQKISISQKEKIRTWLKNEDNESESTLSLNLSKLISFFLSEDKNENLSIYKSKIFTLKSVKINEVTPK